MASGPEPNPNPYLDPENAALLQALGKATGGKQITQLSLAEARADYRKLVTPALPHPGVSITHFFVDTTHGRVKTFVFRPTEGKHGADQLLPFVYHIHGGGWILGNAFLYREFAVNLAKQTGYAVVVPEYTLAPEAQYPVQQEQCLEILQWLIANGRGKGLRTDRVAISGDSAGGQLAPAVSILNVQRSLKLPIVHQILLNPLVDSTPSSGLIGTFSQYEFQNGPFLTTAFIQEAFRDYFGEQVDARSSITASPILMTSAEAFKYMPPTMIVTSQNDWLRDQGENFAKLLQTAGVACGAIQMFASVHDAATIRFSDASPTSELIFLTIKSKLSEVLVASPAGAVSSANGDDGAASPEKTPSKRKRR